MRYYTCKYFTMVNKNAPFFLIFILPASSRIYGGTVSETNNSRSWNWKFLKIESYKFKYKRYEYNSNIY